MDALPSADLAILSPFLSSDFPDERLFRRALRCLKASVLGQLTAASDSEALRKGKDRFCHNKRLPADQLLKASSRQPPEAWAKAEVVLSSEDTSLVRAGGRFEPADAGPLSNSFDHGYVIHNAFGLLPGASFPEAWLGAVVWTRSWDLHLHDHKKRSPEERESLKWSELRRQIHRQLRAAGVRGRIISLNDREGDNWTSLWVALAQNHELITRVTQNRALDHGDGKFKAFLRRQPVIAELTMPLYGKGKARHRPRQAKVQVRWSEVTLLPPKSAPADQDEPLTMTGIHVREVGRGEKRFESFLLTTCPVRTDEEALEVVGWYSHRWASEVGYDVLKNGLGLEKEPVENVEAFKRLLALEGPVAVQVARWVHLSRQPKPPAVTKMFDRATLDELRQACRFYREKAPERWTLTNAVETLARIGGADVRPNRKPGWRVVMRGWQRFEQFRQIRAFTQTGELPQREAEEREEPESEEEGEEPFQILWKRRR